MIEHTYNIALVGAPNCGKTALFNLLTGSRQKVANYAGVTVEKKEGPLKLKSRISATLIDLPGTYSLSATSPDEEVTRNVLLGSQAGESAPDFVVCVVDANNLQLHLRLALELKALDIPMLLALNMMDEAKRNGIAIDTDRLEEHLGIPVLSCVAVERHGADSLRHFLSERLETLAPSTKPASVWYTATGSAVRERMLEVKSIVAAVVRRVGAPPSLGDRIDDVVMHPVAGLLILALVLFLMFQAVFTWAQVPMEWIKSGIDILAETSRTQLPEGPLASLIADGVISGAGSVVVFLPQILILFTFIIALEDSGYLPRAAFLLDRAMMGVGLSGRAFIPLLSSFACAIPGIMATRTIPHVKDRIMTLMIAPLMTCSARLPVYALLIAAFVPNQTTWGGFSLQGLVLFLLYLAGIVSALLVAGVTRLFGRSRGHYRPLLLELPPYRLPVLRNLVIALWERASIFISRVGSIILALMILLWFLSSYPAAPVGATEPAIHYSFAGILGHWIEPFVAPIGFNWQIAIALIPGLAAREVAVGALATVYAISNTGNEVSQSLIPMIQGSWSLATAYALMAWYVFAPQCVATLSVVRRETNSWRYPTLMAAYLFGLAYLAAFITYRASL
jgi:ferrous iron transport protein B